MTLRVDPEIRAFFILPLSEAAIPVAQPHPKQKMGCGVFLSLANPVSSAILRKLYSVKKTMNIISGESACSTQKK